MSAPLDLVVVGAGIVGLATARAALRRRPGSSVVVLDKESSVGAHQTGHNSGVLHAGVYYRPGSAKARLCVSGRERMVAYCADRGVAHRVCGKLVVATDATEEVRLWDLESRCGANGVEVRRLDAAGIREIEPHATGRAALHVLATGVVDFGEVARALAGDVADAGGEIRLGTSAIRGREAGGALVLTTSRGDLEARRVVGCAGLHADRMATAISGPGADGGIRIVPFRGEYHRLRPERAALVRGLLYPVPDPALPFLGVHLTRGIDGHVHAGPNAVLALSREGYTWRDVDAAELLATLVFPGFRRLAGRQWRHAAGEVARSLSRAGTAAALRRLCPEIRADDLVRAPAGVRAQAVAADGSLIDDFLFVRRGRALHVLNAPSPAATASLAIADVIVDQLELD